MSKAGTTLKRLERQWARADVTDRYALEAQERLEALSDEQLLRELARLCHRWADGPPEGPFTQNYAIADVDAMIDAGNLDGAWAFLERQIVELEGAL